MKDTLENKVKNILNLLRRDSGINNYKESLEQFSWILYLKILNDATLANDSIKNSLLDIHENYLWSSWFKNGKFSIDSTDILTYVNNKLFPYLQNLPENKSSFILTRNPFFSIKNKIESETILLSVIEEIDKLTFSSLDTYKKILPIYDNWLFELSQESIEGAFYTPTNLTNCIAQIISLKSYNNIYDGAAGIGGFLISSYNLTKEKNNIERKIKGVEIDSTTYLLGTLNFILNRVKNFVFEKNDTLKVIDNDKYDVILSHPPFGKTGFQQKDNISDQSIHVAFLKEYIKKLSLNGRCVVVMPDSFLFSNISEERELRRKLIEEYNLHTILSLPNGFFAPYSGVKTSVLFFDKGSITKNIWFYNCSDSDKSNKNIFQEFINNYESRNSQKNISYAVSVEEISNNEYNLSSQKYNHSEDVFEPLNILCELQNDIRNKLDLLKTLDKKITSLNNLVKKKNIESFEDLYLKDIAILKQGKSTKDDNYNTIGRFFTIEKNIILDNETSLSDSNNFFIESGNIIMQNAGSINTIGHIAYIMKDSTIQPTANQIIIRSNQKINSKYLFLKLWDSLDNKSLRNMIVHSSVARLNTQTLNNITLKIPPINIQNEIVKILFPILLDLQNIEKDNKILLSNIDQLKSSILIKYMI